MHSGLSARMTRVGTRQQKSWLISHIVCLGCIPAEEMRFVLMNLPGGVSEQGVDEMISTVDRNKDGRISFSEFRWVFSFLIKIFLSRICLEL